MWLSFNKTLFIKTDGWDFPGGPAVKTSTAGIAGLIPGQGTKILHAVMLPKEKNKARWQVIFDTRAIVCRLLPYIEYQGKNKSSLS